MRALSRYSNRNMSIISIFNYSWSKGKMNMYSLTRKQWGPIHRKHHHSHLKRPWCWERLKEGEQGEDRGWDGWMASPTQWAWVWVNSGSWWWTGRPDVLQSMGSHRVRHDWATEPNWTEVPFVLAFWTRSLTLVFYSATNSSPWPLIHF